MKIIKLKCPSCGWQYTTAAYDMEDKEIMDVLRACPCGSVMDVIAEREARE